MSAPHEGDKSAGFTGLILGSIAIFVIVFAIVRLTNAMYANKHEGPAAEAHAAPAATAPAATAPAATAPAAGH
jgi:hypothetical protein